MDEPSARILSDINKLAGQLQRLRLSQAEPSQIKIVDDRLRARWAELRALRASSGPGAPRTPERPDR